MIRVIESDRFLSTSEHIIRNDKTSEWVATDVKSDAINSLGVIGDMRAVPVLKKYLKKPPPKSYVPSANVAYALYQITGKLFKYKDRSGNIKRLEKPVEN